jgi:hypothetical protein
MFSVGYKGPSPPPEINMKIPSNHLDFSAILPLISNLEELILCFRVISIKSRTLKSWKTNIGLSRWIMKEVLKIMN